MSQTACPSAPLRMPSAFRVATAVCAGIAITVSVLAAPAAASTHTWPAPWGVPARVASPPGTPRFFNYTSPNGVGDDSGEPSIGSNWRTEQVFSNSRGSIPNGGSVNYFGGFSPYMLNVVFDDCQSPARATWNQRPLLTANTPRVFGDPILFTDHTTGRTFVSQEEGATPAGSTTDITDDDGAHFSPSQGSGAPSCVDHQTVGGGPFHAPLTGTTSYPDAVYYCSQCVGDAVCALSLDGGVTFLPSVPMFTINDCAGLHGHIKVGPDGTAFVPDKACGGSLPYHEGGEAAVIVSEDNGTTWAIRRVPGSTSMVDDDASVGVGVDGDLYLGWQSADGHPRIARSANKGLDWDPIADVGASLGIQNCTFPAVVAGDHNRAAFTFYGTTTAGAYDQPEFPGVWYLYIATTFDGGATWTTQNVTPGDPVQRGGVCGSGDCRNQLDFFDMTIDKEGRILIGWDDGCVNGCVSAPPNSFAAKAVITRQTGGMRMFAAYDPVEPNLPEAPGLKGSLANATVSLTWPAPDDGGSAFTGYNIYRAINGGSFTLLANVAGTDYADNINPGNLNVYRVTAVNAQGEGPYCHEFAPAIVATTPCVAPGLLAVNDLLPDGSDNDTGQNRPADPSVNVKELLISEPYAGEGVNRLTLTLQLGTGGTLTPSSQWYIVWNRSAPAADASDRRFVAMKSDAGGALSFVYGDFGPPIPLDGSIPPPNSNTPTPLGNADFGSYNPASGVAIIKLSDALADGTPRGPGDVLSGINVRTYLARPDAGQKSQNNASDITPNGSYTLVGNASCFCYVDHAPVARLVASPAEGTAPMTTELDASASNDPDAGDAIGSYTFNFGDGSEPVTQSNPRISHTYESASGPSGYFATATVKDQKCDRQSLNVASANITVHVSVAVAETKETLAFRIAPKGNPSRGQAFFTLDLDREGRVNVDLFSADGRRVADLIDARMPAGRHTIHWRGLDASGRPTAAGVYLVRARSEGRVAVTRMVLMQ